MPLPEKGCLSGVVAKKGRLPVCARACGGLGGIGSGGRLEGGRRGVGVRHQQGVVGGRAPMGHWIPLGETDQSVQGTKKQKGVRALSCGHSQRARTPDPMCRGMGSGRRPHRAGQSQRSRQGSPGSCSAHQERQACTNYATGSQQQTAGLVRNAPGPSGCWTLGGGSCARWSPGDWSPRRVSYERTSAMRCQSRSWIWPNMYPGVRAGYARRLEA